MSCGRDSRRVTESLQWVLCGFCFVFCVGVLGVSPLKAEPALVFVPLPMENLELTEARNRPLQHLLAELLNRPVVMRLIGDHASLLEALAQGEIDLVELGPLPFLLAKEKTADLWPVATFREPDVAAQYRCVLVAPVDGITTVQQLQERTEPTTVVLTRPQSTCGPTVGHALLAAQGIAPAQVRAVFRGGHDDVALAVLREPSWVGIVKENAVPRFHALGLRRVAASDPVPGVVLVARQDRFNAGELAALSRSLTHLDDSLRDRLHNGQYGFAPFADDLFQYISQWRTEAAAFWSRAAD